MKLDINRMQKDYEKNFKKLPLKVRIEGLNFVKNNVEKLCQEAFPSSIGNVHYVNCPNPFMKQTSDTDLIKYCMIYGTIPEHNDEHIRKMFDEIESRGHCFVTGENLKSTRIK